jgi:hypothetical protein
LHGLGRESRSPLRYFLLFPVPGRLFTMAKELVPNFSLCDSNEQLALALGASYDELIALAGAEAASLYRLHRMFALPQMKCYRAEGIASLEMLPGPIRGSIKTTGNGRQRNGDEDDSRIAE